MYYSVAINLDSIVHLGGYDVGSKKLSLQTSSIAKQFDIRHRIHGFEESKRISRIAQAIARFTGTAKLGLSLSTLLPGPAQKDRWV
jgi:hypothetical protein